MNDDQIALIAAIVIGYYWWHAKKGVTKKSRPVSGGTKPNTIAGAGSVSPTTVNLSAGGTSATAGSGTNNIAAPVMSIGSLNGSPQRAAAGTGIQRGQMSSGWGGVGTAGISPTWPTTQVTSTKRIKVGSGKVQVPSYTAIPVVTRGPGGAGSILNFGG